MIQCSYILCKFSVYRRYVTVVYFVFMKLKHKRMNYGITGYNKPGFQVLEVQKFHAQVA